jgi:hypothetical protein
VKLLPVMVTAVLPVVGPVLGDTDVTAGTGKIKVNWSDGPLGLVPPTVVTVMSTIPVPAGEVALIEVAELTV